MQGVNSNSTRDREPEYIQYVGLDRSTRLLRRGLRQAVFM